MSSVNINEDYVSIGKAALILDLSSHTITRWYKWWESEEFEKPADLYLPPYVYKDRRKTKFFKKEDIAKLEEFHTKITTTHLGCMAEFNAVYQWGKRGKRALSNKGQDHSQVKNKMR